MGSVFGTPAFFAAYAKVAHEFHLPFLFSNGMGPLMLASLNPTDIPLDAVVIAGPQVSKDHWKEFYLEAVKNLKPGITYMIVHLGHDDAELQAVMVNHPDYGAAWRQRDYDVVNSLEFRKALKENNIVLVKWGDLKKLM